MQGSPASAAVAAAAGGQKVYAGEYRLRDKIRGAMRGGPVSKRQASSAMSAATPSARGYSLAIPVSLITRSYLAS